MKLATNKQDSEASALFTTPIEKAKQPELSKIKKNCTKKKQLAKMKNKIWSIYLKKSPPRLSRL